MIWLNRKTHYAMAALVDLTREHPATVSARAISKKYRLPLPALTNILSSLVHADLVVSTRGPKGGYRLARPAKQILITDLIEAVEGAVKLAICCPTGADDEGSNCELADLCPIRDPIGRIQDIVRDVLNQVTLEQVAWGNVPAGVRLGMAENSRNQPGHLAGKTRGTSRP